MTGLVRWLRHQLDIDEQAADMVAGLRLGLAAPPPADTQPLAFLSPEQYVNLTGVLSADRIRAEVHAKRRILDRHAACGTGDGHCDGARHEGRHDEDLPACADLFDLAAPFAHRAGSRAHWHPAR